MTPPRLPNPGDTVDLVPDGFRTFGTRDWPGQSADRPPASRFAVGLSGQDERPLRIAAFKTAEGWARDVTAQIAHEVLALADQDLSPAGRDVVERAG